MKIFDSPSHVNALTGTDMRDKRILSRTSFGGLAKNSSSLSCRIPSRNSSYLNLKFMMVYLMIFIVCDNIVNNEVSSIFKFIVFYGAYTPNSTGSMSENISVSHLREFTGYYPV